MNGNSSFLLDLIILVALGVFIYTRFFSTKLPKDEQKNRQKGADVFRFPPKENKEAAEQERAQQQARMKAQMRPVKPRRPSPAQLEGLSGIDKVRAYDPSFSEKEFLSGAKEAYRMYHMALAEGDEKTLEALLSPRLLDDAFDTLDSLREKGQQRQTRIENIEDVQVVDSRINGRTIIMDVKYTANQAQSDVKKGSAVRSKPKKTSTVWTWARNVDEADPNWELEAMTPVA